MAIPSHEKDLKGRPGHLDEVQQKAFDEFKQKAEEGFAKEGSGQRKWFDDTTLLRFLRARSFSVPKALQQFQSSSAWRHQTKVDEIFASMPVEEFEASRAFYPRWTGRRDKLGRPIYVFRLASLAGHSKDLMATPEERRYQRIISLTELLCRFVLPLCSELRPEAGVDCVTTIIDLEGVSLTSLWSLKSHLQQSISLTSNNYPETINTICVVNSPSFFPTIWSWVKGMFDEGTRNKVHVFGAEPGAELQEVIPAENLPKAYGGQQEWKYEDEPMLDDEIQAKIGRDGTKGPVLWEDGKVVELGEVRANKPSNSTSTATSTKTSTTATASASTASIPTSAGPPATTPNGH